MQTFKDFMVQSLSEAGLSDEAITSALEKLYAHDKLSPKLNQLVRVATEDYNAQMGRAQALQQRIDRLEKEWYPQANAEYQRAMAELMELRNAQGQTPQVDMSKYVSQQDLVNFQRELGMRMAGVLKDTAKITAGHVTRFREEPDIEAIDRLATEQGLPLMVAYEKYIQPRVKEEEKKANEEWKKQQREEIERDVRSRYRLPAEEVPTEQSPLFTHHKAEDLPKDIDSDLLSTWRSVPAKT